MNDNYTTDFFNVVTPEQLTSQSFITEDGVKVVNLQMKAHDLMPILLHLRYLEFFLRASHL